MTETTTETAAPKKALTRQDQRNLEKLIDSDFRDAQNQLDSAADNHVREAKKALEAQYADLEAKAVEIATDIAEFENSIREQWRAKVEDIRAHGFEILDGYGNVSQAAGQLHLSQKVQPAGKADALRKIQDEASFARQEAWRELDRARNRALRGVYIAGISGQKGLELLNSIPTAADAFAAALPKPEQAAVEA